MAKVVKKEKYEMVEKKAAKVSKDVKHFVNHKKILGIKLKKILIILACLLCLFLFFKLIVGVFSLIFAVMDSA